MKRRILPDVNVWLALSLAKHDLHSPAQDQLDRIDDMRSVAFCRQTQQGLLRLLTSTVMLQAHGHPALRNDQAWLVNDKWLSDGRIFMAPEPPELLHHWKAFGAIRTSSPKLWMDAYLAAFAVAGDFTLVTNDKAFKQFKGLDLLLLK